jgi:hypothetical protein
VLELETTALHVPDPMVGCIYTPTMVAIPLFSNILYLSTRLLLDFLLPSFQFTDPARVFR